MIKIVESKEIIKNLINLIWKATEKKVVTVTFNSQLCLATISLDNGINITLNLEVLKVVLIKEDIFSKIINKHAGFMINDGNRDNESFSQVDENDKLNSNYEVTKGIGENISGDDSSNDDSPRWLECEECYRPKKEFCDLCGCSVCKWKAIFKKASLHHSPEVNNDIIKSINDYEDDIKEKEQMRYSSSKTELIYESTSLCTKVLSKEQQISEYVDLLKEARREITENFPSHQEKIFEMFSQYINKYFKDSLEASLEPKQFPKIIEDNQGCTKYLAIWDSHFNNCKGLIEIQDYKMLKLVYSLTDVFFIMLSGTVKRHII
ncbi:17373_t:CDS:2, partial [Racocetra persica]